MNLLEIYEKEHKDNEIIKILKDEIGEDKFKAYLGDHEAECKVAIDLNEDEKAFKFMERSALGGYPRGQLFLGLWYRMGKNVEVDYEKAEFWYNKAADQGQGTAFYNIGCMYEKGYGKVINIETAYEYYEKAKDLGCYYGYRNIAIAHYLGTIEGYEKDYEKAYNLFLKSIELGETTTSHFYISLMYAKGHFVKQNINKALSYLEKGKDLGSEKCIEKYDKILYNLN